MRFLANLVWFLAFGWWLAALCYIVGVVLLVTILGAPLGILCFKLGNWIAWPFGRSRPHGTSTNTNTNTNTIVINNMVSSTDEKVYDS